jgi:SSS family solute:Na+ symporter
MQLATLDLVVIAAYFVGVVGLGCWFVRSSLTSTDFMTAGGTLPAWAIGLSILGTYLSSNTFILVPARAYASNWDYLWFSLTLLFAAGIAARYFVPMYRNQQGGSAYQRLEERFGSWARTYGVICYLLTQLARTGAIYAAISLVMVTLTGWSQWQIIVGSGVAVTLYTALGGIEAVIWTDVVQCIVLIAGAILMLLVMLLDMPGGPAEAISLASQAEKFSLGGTEFDLALGSTALWIPLFYGLCENTKNFGIDQGYVQRYQAASSTRDAVRSLWLGSLVYVPLSLVFLAIGTASYAYYQTHPALLGDLQTQMATERLVSQGQEITPDSLAAVVTELEQTEIGDRVVPHFILRKLPDGVTGLLVAAIFAAAMSSIDTSLNSSATVIYLDIYKRHLRPACGEREAMIVLHAGTCLMGCAGVGVALAMIGVKSILDAYWVLTGAFSGGLLGLFLLSLIAHGLPQLAAAIGVLAGILVTAGLSFPDWLALPAGLRLSLHANMITVVATLVVFVVGLACARLLAGRHRVEI